MAAGRGDDGHMKQVILLLVMIFVITSFAAAETLPTEVPYLYEMPQSILPSPKPTFLIRLHLGKFYGEEVSPNLTGEKVGSVAGVEVDLYPMNVISYQLEVMAAKRDHDIPAVVLPPPLLVRFDDAYLETDALLVGVRATYPAEQFLRLHATGGVGFFMSKLAITGTMAGLPVEKRISDSSLGFHAGAGIDAAFDKWVLGVEYHHWFIDGNFDDFDIGDVNLGGDLYTVSIGKIFH